MSVIMTVSDNDDWLVQESRMAKAKAHHERTSLFGQWCTAGHITVMEDNDPVNIRLRIEDEFFAEPRDRFPSTTLIAKLQLAIYAGRSCKNENPFGPPNAGSYHSRWAQALESAYRNVAQITATVKKPRRPRP